MYPAVAMLAAASALTPIAAVAAQPSATRVIGGGAPAVSARPNDHRTSAGIRRGDTLRVHLEMTRGVWRPNGEKGIAIEVETFAEEGRAPLVPGPLLRVTQGTVVEARVTNRLAHTATLHGLHDHDGRGDTLVLAAGTSQTVRFRANTVGSHLYWARTNNLAGVFSRYGDSQLLGALVVDPVGVAAVRRNERLLVITSWQDSVRNPRSPYGSHQIYAVNGLSWPHTERLQYQQGDTVTWRVLNASQHTHPMHLHGFHFTVRTRGSALFDTLYTAAEQREGVTEFLAAGSTMKFDWVAERAGNWLFHCHSINHIDEALRLNDMVEGHASHARVTDAMAGLVNAITVVPRRTIASRAVARRMTDPVPRHRLRLHVTQQSSQPGRQPAFAYVLQEGATAPARDSLVLPGSALVLQRGEPTEITVLNRATVPTAVHWHGIELESFYDGVAGWSGAGSRVAPMIAPGDSFVVRFTPPRSGAFLYHTHMGELAQLTGGLYGALFVQDDRRHRDSTDRVFVLSEESTPNLVDTMPRPYVNGRFTPDTVHLQAGVTYRLRFLTITAVSNRRIRILDDDKPAEWLIDAKDGAARPPASRTPRPADVTMGPGETIDVLYTPRASGRVALEIVRLFGGQTPMRVPVVITPSGR